MGDIENMVYEKGLEGTLTALREAGVYITFEEFKGREPMVRNGEFIHIKESDFDNPFLRHYYQSESGDQQVREHVFQQIWIILLLNQQT